MFAPVSVSIEQRYWVLFDALPVRPAGFEHFTLSFLFWSDMFAGTLIKMMKMITWQWASWGWRIWVQTSFKLFLPLFFHQLYSLNAKFAWDCSEFNIEKRWIYEINSKYFGSWSIWSVWLINTVPHNPLSTCCCLHVRASHSAFIFLCVYWSARRWHVNTIIFLLPWLISQHCRLIEVRQRQPSDGKWAALSWQQVQHSNYEKRTAIKLGHDSSEPTLCDFTVYI